MAKASECKRKTDLARMDAKQGGTMTWNSKMMCDVIHIELDEAQKKVIYTVKEGHCTDMMGAVNNSQSYMPDVKEVQIFDEGHTLYSIYVKNQPRVGRAPWTCIATNKVKP